MTALDILQIYLHSRVYKCLLLCSQDRYQEWCLVCLIFHIFSSAILLPLCLIFFKVNYLVLQFAVNIFFYCYITLEFLILCHNLVHAFCKFFNFFTEFMQIKSKNKIKSDCFNEFNADSDKFKIFALLSPILKNIPKCPRREMKILKFRR